MEHIPIIGITMGDPFGVGPEIILKALSASRIYGYCKPIVIGDPQVLSDAAGPAGWQGGLCTISCTDEANPLPNHIDVICPSGLKSSSFSPGSPSAEGGKAAAQCIEEAVGLAMAGELDAIVTCPINKAMLNAAGYAFEGHTQMIAHLTGAKSYVMMLAGSRLRVCLVTIHVSLRQVPDLITQDKVYQTIALSYSALRQDFAISAPRLAVAALNPHAGEQGLFGREEEEVISPAISRAKREGITVYGPFPADTLFWRAAQGQFDAVIAMYHDQGLGPLKLIHFYDAANITLGLPIVRTSVDHGTAYELAGTGKANPSSLMTALQMASMIVKNRKKEVPFS